MVIIPRKRLEAHTHTVGMMILCTRGARNRARYAFISALPDPYTHHTRFVFVCVYGQSIKQSLCYLIFSVNTPSTLSLLN